MSDKKKLAPMSTATLDDVATMVKTLIADQKEGRAEQLAILEQLAWKLESILVRPGAAANAKKPVVKKAKEPKEVKETKVAKGAKEAKDPKAAKAKPEEKAYFNAMYWFAAMVGFNDMSVRQYYTEEDVKNIEDTDAGIKGKTNVFERRRAVGLVIWKKFPQAKKTVELKTAFLNWEKGVAQNQAKDVEKETQTDNEEEEAKEEEEGDDE